MAKITGVNKDKENKKFIFTIIVAVFNGVSTLQKCIDSIAAQTLRDYELIIIDGGSSDGTIEVIKNNEHVIRYWISEPDKGIYNAWNKGLSKATGEWICFLGSDDFFWDANVLQRIYRGIDFAPEEIRIIYGKMMVVNSKGESLFTVGDCWEKVQSQFMQLMCIPHPGTMHHISIFEEHGEFDESFRIAGDYELLLRELKYRSAFYIGGELNIGMTQGGISSNPANAYLSLKEARRAQRMHGMFIPRPLWLLATLRVSVRLFLWNVIGETKTRKALDVYRRFVGLPKFWTKI